jgi:hypothetical protein
VSLFHLLAFHAPFVPPQLQTTDGATVVPQFSAAISMSYCAIGGLSAVKAGKKVAAPEEFTWLGKALVWN